MSFFFWRGTKISGLGRVKGKITLLKGKSRLFRNIVKFMKFFGLFHNAVILKISPAVFCYHSIYECQLWEQIFLSYKDTY